MHLAFVQGEEMSSFFAMLTLANIVFLDTVPQMLLDAQ